MTRTPALAATLAVAFAATVASAQTDAPRPNILYIVADDLGWADVGFHGSDIRTPSLDALAAEGAQLAEFYVQPMCTQTRAALMTGRYPLRYGLQSFVILPDQTYGIPLEERLLPEILRDAGYETAIIGKWHLGHADPAFWPRQRGFDYQYGALIGEIDYFTHEISGVTDWYRDNEPIEEEGYVTTLLGEDAVRFIEGYDSENPFFLYLAFTAPHTPFQAPEDELSEYGDIADLNRRAYAAMISEMDDQIGAVLDAIEAKGLAEDTLVIFHSDNGGVRTAMLAGQIDLAGELAADARRSCRGEHRGHAAARRAERLGHDRDRRALTPDRACLQRRDVPRGRARGRLEALPPGPSAEPGRALRPCERPGRDHEPRRREPRDRRRARGASAGTGVGNGAVEVLRTDLQRLSRPRRGSARLPERDRLLRRPRLTAGQAPERQRAPVTAPFFVR